MPFEHKSEYNISIGHSATIKNKIDGAVGEIDSPFLFVILQFPGILWESFRYTV